MMMYGLGAFCWCTDGMVMASAYEVSCNCAGGCDMSDVYIMKRVRGRHHECSLNVVYALRFFI